MSNLQPIYCYSSSRLPRTRTLPKSTLRQRKPKLIMISPWCPSYIYRNSKFTLDNSNLLLAVLVILFIFLPSITRIKVNFVLQYVTNQNKQCTAVQTIKFILKQPFNLCIDEYVYHSNKKRGCKHRFSLICGPSFSALQSFSVSLGGSSYRESTVFLVGKWLVCEPRIQLLDPAPKLTR